MLCLCVQKVRYSWDDGRPRQDALSGFWQIACCWVSCALNVRRSGELVQAGLCNRLILGIIEWLCRNYYVGWDVELVEDLTDSPANMRPRSISGSASNSSSPPLDMWLLRHLIRLVPGDTNFLYNPRNTLVFLHPHPLLPSYYQLTTYIFQNVFGKPCWKLCCLH